MVVEGINDCASTSPGIVLTDSPARGKTRRISASFPNTETSCASPITDKSSMIATATTNSDKSIKKVRPWRKPSLLAMSLKPLLKSSSTYMLLLATEDTENAPSITTGEGENNSTEGRLISKLPKSRTMTRLHELKKSISRQTLANRCTNVELPRQPSARKVTSFQKPSKADLDSPSSISEDASSTSTPSTAASFFSAPDIGGVDTPQSSAYWTGRFVALHDRFSYENIAKACKSSQQRSLDATCQSRLPTRTSRVLQGADNNLANLKQSNTTMALTEVQSSERCTNQDEDSKCIKIFQELDSLCTTSAAKESLCAWQLAFARRHRRPKLIPEGYSMNYSYSRTKLLRPGRISGGATFPSPIVRGLSAPRVPSSILASTPCRAAKAY